MFSQQDPTIQPAATTVLHFNVISLAGRKVFQLTLMKIFLRLKLEWPTSHHLKTTVSSSLISDKQADLIVFTLVQQTWQTLTLHYQIDSNE